MMLLLTTSSGAYVGARACHSASLTTKASMVAMIADEPVMTPRNIALYASGLRFWCILGGLGFLWVPYRSEFRD